MSLSLRHFLVLSVAATVLMIASIANCQPQLLGVLKTNTKNTFFGNRIILLGDQNNDSFDDILIGENFRNLLFYGGDPFDSTATLDFDSTNPRANNIGDINSDGYDDFTVPGRSPINWKLNLYLGGPLVDTTRDLWFGLDTLGPIGYTANGYDINSNGTIELISWEGQNQQSVLFNELEIDSDSVPDFELFPANITLNNFSFGRGLVTGDFNGDGKSDLAVSFNPSRVFNLSGAVYLYWGSINFDTIPDLVLRRPGQYINGADRFGVILENLGDVNADGYDDLFASSGGASDDSVGFIYFGGPLVDSIPNITIPTRHTNARAAGDVNNDGLNDLILSLWTNFSTIGWVEIFLGGSPMDTIPDVRFDVRDVPGFHIYYGLDCSGVGDFNGDGIDDFAFSSGRGSGVFETYIYSGWNLSTDIEFEHDPVLPSDFSLSQNFPNPFNPSTVIEFSLPHRSYSSLVIYNSLGQQIRNLFTQQLSAGTYRLTWDGKDEHNRSVPSGVYFYKLRAGETELAKKMILLK